MWNLDLDYTVYTAYIELRGLFDLVPATFLSEHLQCRLRYTYTVYVIILWGITIFLLSYVSVTDNVASPLLIVGHELDHYDTIDTNNLVSGLQLHLSVRIYSGDAYQTVTQHGAVMSGENVRVVLEHSASEFKY